MPFTPFKPTMWQLITSSTLVSGPFGTNPKQWRSSGRRQADRRMTRNFDVDVVDGWCRLGWGSAQLTGAGDG